MGKVRHLGAIAYIEPGIPFSLDSLETSLNPVNFNVLTSGSFSFFFLFSGPLLLARRR